VSKPYTSHDVSTTYTCQGSGDGELNGEPKRRTGNSESKTANWKQRTENGEPNREPNNEPKQRFRKREPKLRTTKGRV